MATFYLLPPRPVLGARFASYLGQLFPGLNWSSVGWSDLVEMLDTATSRHKDVYFIYREDLPEGEEPRRALAENFGAETGDEVVEVAIAPESVGMPCRRWQL
jgi:hypothetical protein